MGHKRTIPWLLVTGAVMLMLLLSIACEPSFLTAEVQDLPTHTPTLPTDTPARGTPPATATLPEPDNEKEKQETAVPTLSTERDVTVESDAEKAVAAAKADLMERLGVTEEVVVIKSVKAIQWRDASLGCPQPDMTYAQAVTPGFRVVLEVQGRAYEYHTDAGRLVVLCGVEGEPFDPVPLMPIAPHGIKPAKP